MNEVQLREVIDTALEALEVNRQVVTPGMLAKAEDLLRQYKNDDTVLIVLSTLFGIDKELVPDYFDKILKVLEVEKKLIFTDLTDTISEGLTNLKGRPLVMRLVAALI